MSDSSFRPLISLSWQSVAYGIGVLGQQLVTYLTLPILTLYLDQADFGVVSVLIAFFSLVNVISNAGLPAATFRMYNENDDPDLHIRVLSTAQIMFLGYAVALTICVFVTAEQISVLLLGDGGYANLLRLVSLYLVTYTLTSYGHIVLRIEVRPLAKSLHSIFWTLAEYGLAIWFVVQFQKGVNGYWWGRLLGSLIAMVGVLWLIRRSLHWRFSWIQFREMFKYALPMVPATLALWALRLIDRALITNIVGLNEVAIYEVGYKVGMLAGLITVPFLAAWPQFAFSAMHKPNAPRIYKNVLTFLAVGSTFFGLVVIIFRRELVAVFSTVAYANAANVVAWVALSQIAWALYPVLSLGPKITKQTNVLAWVTGIAAIVNIGLNLALIPRIGIEGAAIATFVAYAFLAVLTYAVGQRHFAFPLDWIRLIKLLATGLLTYFLVAQIDRLGLSYWPDVLLRAGSLSVIFLLLLLGLQFISWQELLKAKNVLWTVWQTRFGKRILVVSK